MDTQPHLASRVAAGLAAVRAQVGFFHEHFGRAASLWKHDGTRVTPADLAISRAVFEELARQFPDDQFFSEETEPGTQAIRVASRYSWMLDPIDGTNNFALGIPVCAISLALLEAGQPVCGFIYDFGARTLLHGGPGFGLFADGVPLRAAPRGDHDEGKVVAIHAPVDARHAAVVQLFLADYKLRSYGSGALHLAYVALGKVDACVDFTVKVWDIAAAWAFCRVTGVETVFFGREPFPLSVFDLHAEPLRYAAGSGSSFRRVVAQLEKSPGLERTLQP
jgi:myo-inositol-1(or 4)-monophosphatase